MKNLATQSVVTRYNSSGPLYTLRLPASTTSTLDVVSYALAAAASSIIWHHCLTLAPTSSPSCHVVQSSPALWPQMIPYVIRANLVGTLR
jgi:hypothetical protein